MPAWRQLQASPGPQVSELASCSPGSDFRVRRRRRKRSNFRTAPPHSVAARIFLRRHRYRWSRPRLRRGPRGGQWSATTSCTRWSSSSRRRLNRMHRLWRPSRRRGIRGWPHCRVRRGSVARMRGPRRIIRWAVTRVVSWRGVRASTGSLYKCCSGSRCCPCPNACPIHTRPSRPSRMLIILLRISPHSNIVLPERIPIRVGQTRYSWRMPTD